MSKGLEHDIVDASVTSDTLEAIREELTCSICLDVLVRPCVTACGHNFCRRCLRRAMKHSPACPDCREPIRLTGTGLRVNTRLWSAVQLLFPESANAPSSPLHEECIAPAQSSSPERQESTPQQHPNPPNMLPTLQSHARRMRSEFEQLQDAFYSVHRVVRQRITESIREAALTPGPMPAPGAMRGNSRSLYSNRAHQHLQSYGELADVPFASQGNQAPTSAPRPYMPGLQGRSMTRTDAPSSGPPALYPSMGSSTLSHSSQPPPSNPMLVMSPHHSTFHSTPAHIAPQNMQPTMVPAPAALQTGSMVSAQSPVSNHAQVPAPPPPNPGMLAPANGPSAGGSNPGSGAFLQDVWMDGLFMLQPLESVPEVVNLALNSHSNAPWSAMPDNRLDDPPFSLVATPAMHQANMHLSPPVPPSSMVNTSRHMGLGSTGVIMGMPPMSRAAAAQPASMPVELHSDDGQGNWNAWNPAAAVQPIPMHRAGSSPMSYVQQSYWLPITE